MIDASIMTGHERVALQFSGGKDSLALAYLLRPYWDRIAFYHVDTGDLLPEMVEIVRGVEAIVPDFRRIETNPRAWSGVYGEPSDLVATANTPAGVLVGWSERRVVDRLTCCSANIMRPMHDAMIRDGVTLVIRGTKAADLPRLPADDGDTSMGYRLWLPLRDWSHADVMAYLREQNAPICRVYDTMVNAPECATCPAWWSEGRAAYLSKHHPALAASYAARLGAVSRDVDAAHAAMRREMTLLSEAGHAV